MPNFEAYTDILPEQAIPIAGLRILSYLNENGTICYNFRHAGDVSVAQILGILEMVKFDLLCAAKETNAGRDDEM